MTNTELRNLMSKMNVPSHRKDKFNRVNLIWLSKNLNVFNSTHKNYDKVINEINNRIKEKEYEN